MEPAKKRTKITKDQGDAKPQLKPSQVSQKSNIFGTIDPVEDKFDESDEESLEDQSFDVQESDEDEEEDDIDDNDDDDDDDDGDDDDDEPSIEKDSSDNDEDDTEQTSHDKPKKKKKNDPNDFATAMSKILSSGLTQSNRKNPILARSIESKNLDALQADAKLTEKAKHQLLAERKAVLDKGHTTNVLGETDEDQARIIERERGLRKVAQRGVVRLFNAIRAAQSSGGVDEVRQGAGVKKREVAAQEVSKSSFLDLIKGTSK